MAIYRQVYMSFWSDTKIDEFTPEDKYFYLYLMTNPHTSLSGCYEISIKQMAYETGYNETTIAKLINKMLNYNVAYYDLETKEMLLLNWYKHNWTCSKDLIKSVRNEASNIKSNDFREYVNKCLCYKENDTLPTPSMEGGGTSVTVSVTDTVTDYKKLNKETKHKYGKYKNVLLTDDQLEELKKEFPSGWQMWVEKVSEYCASTGKSYKNYLATIRNWAKKEQERKPNERKVETSYDVSEVRARAQMPIEYKRKD